MATHKRQSLRLPALQEQSLLHGYRHFVLTNKLIGQRPQQAEAARTRFTDLHFDDNSEVLDRLQGADE
jgi:hypothetical protein